MGFCEHPCMAYTQTTNRETTVPAVMYYYHMAMRVLADVSHEGVKCMITRSPDGPWHNWLLAVRQATVYTYV